MASSVENPEKSSLYLFREILKKKNVIIRPEDLLYFQGKHMLSGFSYGENLKKEPDVLNRLTEITEALSRLCFYLEEDSALSVPEKLLPGELKAIRPGENFTGISALVYFTDREVTVRKALDGNGYEILVPGEVLALIPGGEDYLKKFLKRLISFSEETEHLRFEVVPSICCVSLKEGAFLEKVNALEGRVKSRAEKPEEMPLSPVFKEHMEKTLGEIHDMMDSLDHSNAGKTEIAHRLKLTYALNRLVYQEGYTIAVPDDFSYLKEEEKLIFFLENPENPDLWEASALAFSVFAGQEMLEVKILSSQDVREKEKLKALLEKNLNDHSVRS